MEVGDIVKIKPPFDVSYSEQYTIVSSSTAEDGVVVYFVNGVEGGFSDMYLEKI